MFGGGHPTKKKISVGEKIFNARGAKEAKGASEKRGASLGGRELAIRF